MSAQDRTLDQYHELMHINAVAHLVRAGRGAGLFAELTQGQRTLEQLVQALSLEPESTALLLDALVAIGIVERYEEDFALSQAARLLCQYDQDLGDARWEPLGERLRGQASPIDHQNQTHFDSLAATQWIHTRAAMQAAEVLDIGGSSETQGLQILDIGCGSGSGVARWRTATPNRASRWSISPEPWRRPE